MTLKTRPIEAHLAGVPRSEFILRLVNRNRLTARVTGRAGGSQKLDDRRHDDDDGEVRCQRVHRPSSLLMIASRRAIFCAMTGVR
jgi:hypothetical protein